ncbi:MAG TPA: hypothetical protein DDY98_09040 [Ruminococcaceae bacterium]|nr:hypothetical protein [Oscillospiraceae bacterium]
MHEGHRERVREKFKENGLSCFSTHEVLELLLFYSCPRGDTNATAHRLMERFGSLSAVLEAPYEELKAVEGVGDVAATLVNLVPQLFRAYTADKASKITVMDSVDAVVSFLRPRFFGLTTEHIGLLCLDITGRVNNFTFLSDGSLKIAQVDVRKAAQTALRNNAESVILAHNHPGGLPNPSRADLDTTKTLIRSFQAINIRLTDHIIFSDDAYFSMKQCERFAPIFLLGNVSTSAEAKVSLYQNER